MPVERTKVRILENANAENENPPKRRSSRTTRSTRSLADYEPSPEKPAKNKLSFIKYNGAIKYYTQAVDIASVSDELLQWVQKQGDVVPIAFDMEWPFTFQTGPGKSALIQVCADEKECYLFHLTELKKLPAALMALLSHASVRLHGVNIKNDIRKLKRDFPEVNVEPLIENCIDLGPWCNQVCNTGGRWSLDRLAAYTVEKAVDKNKKVRMSKWHVIPLDENQKMYAAIDVYCSTLVRSESSSALHNKMKSQVIIDKIQAKLDAYDQSKRTTFKVFQINFNDSNGSLLKSIVLDLKEFKIYEGSYDSPDGSITIADEDFFGLATKTVQASDLLAADKIQLDGDFEAIKKLLDRLTE